MLPMYGRDRAISIEGGLLWQYQYAGEALTKTGMLQHTIREWDKLVEVKQQGTDYISWTPVLQISWKVTQRMYQTGTTLPIGFFLSGY